MLLRVHPENVELRKIRTVVDTLRKGGVVIYPTDTVYGIGCDLYNPKAMMRIAQIRGLNPKKAKFSLICSDMSMVSEYTPQLSNDIFKTMKQYLPGPVTFIVKSNNNVPKVFKNKRKTIGIRIPDNNITLAIVEELGHPVLNASIVVDDEIQEYLTDPEEIYETYRKQVDLVIDGGLGGSDPSAVIDCTGDIFEVIRGEIDG